MPAPQFTDHGIPMNFKATYAFLALFAVLAAFLFLVDEPRQEARQQEAERQSLVLPDLDPGQVSAVTVRSASGTVRVERGEGDRWKMTAPVPDRGNAGRVLSLLADLGALKAEREVAAAGADLEPFGLAEPDLVVVLEGPTLILAVGAENPAGDARYLRAGNGPVQVVKSHQVTSLLLDPVDLRQPELLADAPWEQLSAVEVGTGDDPPLRLEREGERWWLRQPLAAEADLEAVGRLTDKLRWARASGFPDSGGEADATLATGLAVRLEWGGAAPPVTVQLARVGEAVWAQGSGRDAVLAVATDVWDAVQVTPDALRRRKPVQVKAWRVQGLEVVRGADTRAYRKANGAWQRAGEELAENEADTLQALLETLENTVADEVIDAPAGDAAYGLDAPLGTLAVDLGEGPRQELTLGQTGGRLYARGEVAGPVYVLPAAFADKLAALFADPGPSAEEPAPGPGGDAANR